MLSSNTEELFQLRNHSKILVTKIKKLKNIQKTEQSNEDIEEKLLEKQEENCHLKTHNQDLKEHIKKLKDDEKSQEETFKKIQNDNKLLETN